MTAPRDNDIESDLGFLHRREGIELLERRSVPAACATFLVFENGGVPCASSDGWKMLRVWRSSVSACGHGRTGRSWAVESRTRVLPWGRNRGSMLGGL